MSLTAIPLIANILIHSGGGPLTGSEVKWFFLVVGTIMLVAICWDVVAALVKRKRGRNWPTASAVIDAVSVTVAGGNGISSLAVRDRPYYKATLTYTYRNPEPQMGDYRKGFGSKEEAQTWADSYKGETVKVHVDPSDPTRSVLREEDL